MRTRVFFPQTALDEWVGENRVDIKGEELTLKNEGRRYRIIEAVRILREVTGADDPHELLGRVKTRGFLVELGAELLEGSMILGDNAYDVIQGFVGAPVGSFAEYKKSAPKSVAGAGSDDELLGRFLASAGN
ncbi:MAG: hypothetical protein QM820_12620 [Minicystis sp.]